jgi:formylglycine-generating enzyme required for sulfatase activity
VTWSDVQKFVEELNRKEPNVTYRLPTEAEWEYACRAGTETAYWFDSDPSELSKYGWFTKNSEAHLSKSGVKGENPWGLCDVHGNVWEWCADHYGKFSTEPVKDPTGAVKGSSRVARGGSWCEKAAVCRSARRKDWAASYSWSDLGFRLVRE